METSGLDLDPSAPPLPSCGEPSAEIKLGTDNPTLQRLLQRTALRALPADDGRTQADACLDEYRAWYFAYYEATGEFPGLATPLLESLFLSTQLTSAEQDDVLEGLQELEE